MRRGSGELFKMFPAERSIKRCAAMKIEWDLEKRYDTDGHGIFLLGIGDHFGN